MGTSKNWLFLRGCLYQLHRLSAAEFLHNKRHEGRKFKGTSKNSLLSSCEAILDDSEEVKLKNTLLYCKALLTKLFVSKERARAQNGISRGSLNTFSIRKNLAPASAELASRQQNRWHGSGCSSSVMACVVWPVIACTLASGMPNAR